MAAGRRRFRRIGGRPEAEPVLRFDPPRKHTERIDEPSPQRLTGNRRTETEAGNRDAVPRIRMMRVRTDGRALLFHETDQGWKFFSIGPADYYR